MNTPTTTKTKPPKLFLQNGEQASILRKKLGYNQSDFWSRIKVTQSGGSRYESGREMPEQVSLLLHLTYGTNRQASNLLRWLRGY